MKIKTSTFYDYFSLVYPIVDYFFKPQKIRLAKELNALTEGKLLEIGVGDASCLHLITKHEIFGIDNSKKMLEIAKKRQPKNSIFFNMNAECLTFHNETFDYIVLSHILSVVDNPRDILDEAFRVLKPKGKVFILNHFTPTNYLKYVDKLFNPFSTFFHFKSLFLQKDIETNSDLLLEKEISFGRNSYYKLLIFRKN